MTVPMPSPKRCHAPADGLAPKRELSYFVYGSNMNSVQLKSRGVRPKRVFQARLLNYRLVFHGHSRTWDGATETVVPEPERLVFGVVLVLSFSAADTLDAWQGVRLDGAGSHFLYPAVVLDRLGEAHEVLVHKLDMLGEPRPPSREYLDFIVRGARERNLPPFYVERLARLETCSAGYPVPVPSRFQGLLAGLSCADCGLDAPSGGA